MSELKERAQAIANAGAAPYVGAAGDPGPDTPSSDYSSMKSLWDKVEAFSGGVEAMRRAAGKYLPKFELEDDADYAVRKGATPFTNVYEDIVQGLSSKPFSREVAFDDPADVDDLYHEMAENIDGQGNTLHVFAEPLFRGAVENAIEWILVDYTRLPPLPEGRTARTQAEEQQLGARAYWVRVPGPQVVAAYWGTARGREVLVHLRRLEPVTEREGYKEVTKERVRVYNREEVRDERGEVVDYSPALWELLEKRTQAGGKVEWATVDRGEVEVGVIPLVPLRTGRRTGNGAAVKAPLAPLADMQVDAFQQESNIRNIEMLTAYPMLTASGVSPGTRLNPVTGKPELDTRVKVGPRAVLWAPPSPGGGQPGEWKFIEPSAENVKMLTAKLERTWSNMREIGMQPLAEANITVITSANVSIKAKSSLQAWALRLEDSLEQAFEITALWLKRDDPPGVEVFKDFGVDLQSGKELDTLVTMAGQGQLSAETLRAEAKRRDVLSDNFDEEQEQQRIAEEAANANPEPDGPDEEEIDPVTGLPLSPDNDDAGGEPVDPAQFDGPDSIDDDTLLRLFGKTGTEAA